jgi:hypothetical protein
MTVSPYFYKFLDLQGLCNTLQYYIYSTMKSYGFSVSMQNVLYVMVPAETKQVFVIMMLYSTCISAMYLTIKWRTLDISVHFLLPIQTHRLLTTDK